MTYPMVITIIMFIALFICIIKEVANPGIIFAFVGIAAAIISGFPLKQIGGWAMSGWSMIAAPTFLMVFAVTYFGILHHSGVFKVLVRWILKLLGKNVTAVCLVTTFLAIATQLDGSGATTAICTLPVMKPVADRFKIRPEILLLVFSFGSTCIISLPWMPGMVEAQAYVGSTGEAGWQVVKYAAIVMVILAIIASVVISIIEKRHGAGITDEEYQALLKEVEEATRVDGFNKGLMIFNGLFTLVILLLMLFGVLNSTIVFGAGLFILIVVNFKTKEERNAYLKTQIPTCGMMALTMFGLGTFLGMNSGMGSVAAIAELITKNMSTSAILHIPFITLLIGLPVSMVIGTTYMAVILPAIAALVSPLGVNPVAYMACYNLCVASAGSATLSLFSAAPYLAINLAGTTPGKWLKTGFLPCWILSIIMTIIAAGIFHLIPM